MDKPLTPAEQKTAVQKAGDEIRAASRKLVHGHEDGLANKAHKLARKIAVRAAKRS